MSKVRVFYSLLTFILCSCAGPAVVKRAPVTPFQKQGQLLYTHDGKPVVGEVAVVRETNGNISIDFSKGGAIPLLKLTRSGSGDQSSAQGIFARGHWQGPPSKAPLRLAGWMRIAEEFSNANNVALRTQFTPNDHDRFVFVFAE